MVDGARAQPLTIFSKENSFFWDRIIVQIRISIVTIFWMQVGERVGLTKPRNESTLAPSVIYRVDDGSLPQSGPAAPQVERSRFACFFLGPVLVEKSVF